MGYQFLPKVTKSMLTQTLNPNPTLTLAQTLPKPYPNPKRRPNNARESQSQFICNFTVTVFNID